MGAGFVSCISASASVIKSGLEASKNSQLIGIAMNDHMKTKLQSD
jgi:hypothetical protein